MQLIPEYGPVGKLYLCFVQDFFNSRFHYGEALCRIIQAARPFVEVEVLVGPDDLPYFLQECASRAVDLAGIRLNPESPGRAILAEAVPVFARDEAGNVCGLVFQNPFLDAGDLAPDFGKRFLAWTGFRPLELGFPFATAQIAVNEDLVLLSDALFQGPERQERLRSFQEKFPSQSFHLVPPLAGELTADLDMYLWPIAPGSWIVSEYPRGTPQAESIEPALRVLRDHGHRVQRVPGLEALIYDDINTMPNYANGIILNRAALVPAYRRREDAIVCRILEDHGYQALPIDCSQVILTNSAIHCISKTVPE